jgi:hypothetical protein
MWDRCSEELYPKGQFSPPKARSIDPFHSPGPPDALIDAALSLSRRCPKAICALRWSWHRLSDLSGSEDRSGVNQSRRNRCANTGQGRWTRKTR